MSDSIRHRVCRGLALLPHEDSLIVLGLERRQVFSGASARAVLPRLFSLLDGTRSDEQVRAELGLGGRQFAGVLDTLAERGLVERATPVPHSPALAEVHTYLSRTAGMSGHQDSGALLNDLTASRVHVVGEPGPAADVAEDLRACGVGEVGVGPLRDTEATWLAQSPRSLAVVLETGADPEVLVRAVARCAPGGTPVLRVASDAAHVELGPCFLPDFTACVHCLRRGRRELGWAEEHGQTESAPTILAGLAASEAFAIISGRPVTWTSRNLARLRRRDWSVIHRLVAPYPDCGCGTGREWSPAEPRTGEVDVFEWAMERPAPVNLRPRGTARDEMRGWIGLPSRRPEFPAHPSGELPPDHLAVPGTYGHPSQQAWPAVALDPVLLGHVLRRTGGFRDEPAGSDSVRWAPNAGGLGSVEIYVVLPGGFDGLPGTVFRYDDTGHRLLALFADPMNATEMLTGTDLVDPGTAGAVLVLVAAQERVAVKYRDFSHRLVHLDAGCASTQLTAVASAHGLTVQFAGCWDDRLGAMLDLSTEGQYVTAVAALRPAQETRHASD
ncbi:hypothetical protein [Saccharomonospora piscinae]|uniref:hypothetical protein n=1 Tax=Saccharomonospora piscinae TaxID=687388 RepID=UPI0004B11CC0|nr:hypothetical protein [Saccharomonospora piscinae]